MRRYNRKRSETRRKLGLNRAEMALLLNISPSALNMQERGERMTSHEQSSTGSRLYTLMQLPLPEDNLSARQLANEKAQIQKVFISKLELKKLYVKRYEDKLQQMEQTYAQCHESLRALSVIRLPEDDPGYETYTLVVRAVQLKIGRKLRRLGAVPILKMKVKIAQLKLEIEMLEEEMKED